MPTHSERQFLPYTQAQLFDMVADVARYSEFLPWCRAARILERKESEMLAELVIHFGPLSESYVSRVTLAPSHRIEANLVRGPFKHLSNRWEFTPEAGGTRIDFLLDFEFRSRLLEKMMGGMFDKAVAKMVEAFKTRAAQLYSQTATPG